VIDVSKSPQKIAGMFDAIAERYDFLNHFLSAGIDKRWRQRAIESLQLTGSETLIDVCTGTGDVAIAAVTHSPAARRVIAVDFAGAMLGVGAAKMRRLRLDGRVTLVRGDATSLPAADRSADAGDRCLRHPQRSGHFYRLPRDAPGAGTGRAIGGPRVRRADDAGLQDALSVVRHPHPAAAWSSDFATPGRLRLPARFNFCVREA
jgi:hypothetical protein